MEPNKLILNEDPTITNIFDSPSDHHDVSLTSKMEASAGVTNNTVNAHNPIVDAINKLHSDHLSMLEDALYTIDTILGKNEHV
jgi:hypothetical protein